MRECRVEGTVSVVEEKQGEVLDRLVPGSVPLRYTHGYAGTYKGKPLICDFLNSICTRGVLLIISSF